MELQPIAHNGQRHPLTTALRNICREYPAGGAVLLELLQNADDAGATEVKFVLDEKTYPALPLIHHYLQQYQGPALLAYNSAIFTDADFNNLARLGDSMKINNGATTGKFGRGFGSVYNWTDSPSIVSRERLNILDPHLKWSRDGGEIYDFVANADNAAIKNHMKAYETVMPHPDKSLAGTVVRIPLRNEAQAKESKISNRCVPVNEMLKVLETFASEFGKSGLLFMKNVDKVTIDSDNTSITIEILDKLALRAHRLKVNSAVQSSLADPNYSFEYSFKVNTKYQSTDQTRTNTFVIHHSIQFASVKDAPLKEWAKHEKLIPWVAVAAEFPIQSHEVIHRPLSTVLPLPITTTQPVHIHGLFSLSPDRAKLHQISDRRTQDPYPAMWNKWILQDAVPVAWTSLLQYMAKLHPRQPAFEKWPLKMEDTRDFLNGSLEKVMQIIESNSLPLWPTDEGFMMVKDSLLAKGDESMTLRDALRDIHAPVVYVPERLQHRSEEAFKGQILCPESLCRFLKSKHENAKSWSESTKRAILEFVMSDPEFTGYDDLQLFPFKDGVYRSIRNWTSFFLRDDIESDLFALDNSHNLDLNKLSSLTRVALKDGCDSSTIHPSIRLRSVKSLKDYCMATAFKSFGASQDSVILDPKSSTLVSKVWAWISARDVDILDTDISCLWIIPLSNGHHRKVTPRSSSSMAYFAPIGEIGDLMRKIDAQSPNGLGPLLNVGLTGLTAGLVGIILNHPQVSKFNIENGGRIAAFLRWLHGNPSEYTGLTDGQKLLIANLVAKYLPDPLSPSERMDIIKEVRPLKIFQRVSWEANNDNSLMPALTWTSLNYRQKSIGLLDGLIPIPSINGIQFLSAEHSSSFKRLLEALQLGTFYNSVQVIQNCIVPEWDQKQSNDWTVSCKEQVAAFILSKFSMLPLDLQSRLQKLPIVPVTTLNSEAIRRFAIASELIDPTVPELRDLVFGSEEIFPKGKFLHNFSVALKGCGLRTIIDEAVVQQRLRCYSQLKYPTTEVQECVNNLLKSAPRWTTPLNKLGDSSEIRCLGWLPAVDFQGNLLFKAANECRSYEDRLLVSSQIPLLQASISNDWKARLGWNKPLPTYVLLSQLKCGIEEANTKIVDAVLTYVMENSLSEMITKELKDIPCVLGSNGLFVPPGRAFCPSKGGSLSCDRLHPYLVNVEHQFWNVHKQLLAALDIREKPSLGDLLEVQRVLEEKEPLNKADQAIAIEILKLAGQAQGEPLTDLKVLDATGILRPVDNIFVHDLGPLKPVHKFHVVHPDVPQTTVKLLGIESLRERLVKGLLEIEDVDDEDEFDQQESVTTRIADTLERYPVETTFREYLANADDAEGASEVNWLFDGRTHSGDNFITPEMERLHGPAFLVHNNGVFTEEDFNGFKNVGQGSKAHDKGTIGQFGRGSQTMYHWTDVPMILSGKYLLILDPQREVLPKNHIKGKRKAGVKLRLSRLRDEFPDQLIPFVGLWGYEQDLDEYQGTIFRFPLRTTPGKSLWNILNPLARVPTVIKSSLSLSKREFSRNEIRQLMEVYFNEARISLLFLRRVKSVGFSIYGDPDFSWSVSRQAASDGDAKSFSELVTCSFKIAKTAGTDRWFVAIEDLLPEAGRLPDTARRVMKNVECGMAALLSSQSEPNPGILLPEAIQSKIFNILPLPLSTELPVHIHGTFSLSGDRQSIAIDEQGPTSYGSKWNRFLLEDALPKLYLSFLDDIGPRIRQDVFKFWPQSNPPDGSISKVLFDEFWKMLPQSTRRLFPKAEVGATLQQRRAAELFELTQAVFDFLPKGQSEVLAPFLTSLGVKLVRNIPILVSKHLKTLPGVKSLTPPFLRKLLKTPTAKVYLQREVGKNERLFDVLLANIIPIDAELADLDGCHILPIANGSLATLSFGDGGQTTIYYVATNKELELFSFARNTFVDAHVTEKLGPLIESLRFNVRHLQLFALRKLLELRPLVTTPNPESDKWLGNFWEYWNDHNDSTLSWNSVDDLHIPIFKASCNGTWTYATPVQFHSLPAVIEPKGTSQQQLCSKIPGLYRFDRKFMPKSTLETEGSLDNAFYKYLRALKTLAGTTTISNFLAANLKGSEIKTLRSLVLSYVACETIGRESQNFLDIRTDLQSIPLWPSFCASAGEGLIRLIPASNALRAADPRLLVPWMRDSTSFINPSSLKSLPQLEVCLVNLGAKEVSNDSLLKEYILPLPSALASSEWQHYERLLGVISSYCFQVSPDTLSSLKGGNIGVDGNGALRKPHELYDHESKIFSSAFRQQANTRFLSKIVRNKRFFFLNLGLRQETTENYHVCFPEMARRLIMTNTVTDPHLEEDNKMVLSLLTNPGSWWTAQDLAKISKEKVFQSREVADDELGYRKTYMATVAAEQKLLCLSEIISPKHIPVCWSQTAFALHQPTAEVLAYIPGGGEPKCITVWQHLEHMKGVAQDLKTDQLGDFISDLRQTYRYLQDHLRMSKAPFEFLKDSPVWLNLSTWDHNSVLLDEFKSSWHSIDDLVLCSLCDSGPIKAVKSGLIQYDVLLRHLGCKSIVYPTLTRPTIHTGRSVSKSLQRLRNDGKLLDITYVTEGRSIEAHRVVLAAISEKCVRQFGGNWAVEDIIEFDQSKDPDNFLSYHTLSTMINYAYEDEIDWTEMQASDEDDAQTRTTKLNLLLDLAKGADYWMIPSLLSQVQDKILVAGRIFINLQNVAEVRERAEEAGAIAVVEMCVKFFEQNRVVVERANAT